LSVIVQAARMGFKPLFNACFSPDFPDDFLRFGM
jgi:hypothetical protein